jgi:hypothetical protein
MAVGQLVLKQREWHLRRHQYRFGCDAERVSEAAHAYSVLALHDPEDSREADISVPTWNATGAWPVERHLIGAEPTGKKSDINHLKSQSEVIFK